MSRRESKSLWAVHLSLLAFLLATLAQALVARAADQPIAVRVQTKAVPDGGEYFQPMNAPNNHIPLYSFDKTRYTVENKGTKAVTLDSVTFKPLGDGQAVEWQTLDAADLKTPKITIAKRTIEPGKSYDFYIQFYPVRGGERAAEVTIAYDGGKAYKFTAKGKGRPAETAFLPQAEVVWERSLGGDITDELTSGLATDGQGLAFFSGNVAQVMNKFNHDIFVGAARPDGSLAWLKGWSGKNQDYQRDPGQNAETGGSAEAIGVDGGQVYLAISHSPTGSNSTYYSVVVQLDAATGKVNWQRAWGPKAGLKIARESSEPYALDASGKHVLVTGVVEGDAKVLLLALDKKAGQVIYQKAIEVAPGTNDRGYSIRADGQGGAYIAGLTSGKGLLMHLSGVQTASPKLDWVQKLSMGIGSNVNSLAVDAEGNAYLSLDRRGATTVFSMMRVDPKGQIGWAKTINGRDRGSKNNAHVIRVFGDDVYVGGRAGIPWHDTQFGDAMLAKLDRNTGALKWAGFYYGGKGAEEMCEHRIKGLALTADGHLLVGGQAYSNPNNHEHFWGYFYACDPKQVSFEDYKGYSLSDETAKASMADVPASFGVQDASALPSYAGYLDLSGAEPLAKDCGVMTWQPLQANQGRAPDGEFFLIKLKLK